MTSAGTELTDLLQFFYQCPVGLLEVHDNGSIRMINPVAVRMLAPLLPEAELRSLLPMLDRFAPEVAGVLRNDPQRMGPLSPGRRLLLTGGATAEVDLELLPVRVEPDRVMIVLLDVSAERRLVRREHELAVAVQRSMFGRVDPLPFDAVGVSYRSAGLALDVGGDWYDVLALPNERIGLVVGDVAGRNLQASAVMGQLRSAIRAMAPWCPDAATLLERADAFARPIDGAACATVAYAVVDPHAGLLTYACAGHPPPLLIRADGTGTPLLGGRGSPLAIGCPVDAVTAEDQLGPGDTLILYTDGFFPRRHADVDDGIRRLLNAAVALRDLPPAELAEQLTARMLQGSAPHDDVCALVLRRPLVREEHETANRAHDDARPEHQLGPGAPARVVPPRDQLNPWEVC